MSQCRIPRPKDPEAAARAEVVELLFNYLHKLRARFEQVARNHDLTPSQAKLLLWLGDPVPMKTLSDQLCCDPSNITGVVDRLAERGLLSRTEDANDRRVKNLEATPLGRQLREAFVAELFAEVPGMTRLTTAQVSELRNALVTLTRE